MRLHRDCLEKDETCPFCNLKSKEIVRKNKHAILFLNRGPYCKDHLLVSPRRHLSEISKMSKSEKEDVEKLIYYGMKILHKKYENISILYREGTVKIGRTIEHLHYHLIPELMIITEKGRLGKDRKFFSSKEYVKKTGEFKEKFVSGC